ncbi:hypothetical protein NKH18_29340 [Streptomyces sp. M10(2022)]
MVESYETCLNDLLEADNKIFAVSTDDVILEGFRYAHKDEVAMLGHPTGMEGWGVGMRHVGPEAKSRPDLEVCKALEKIMSESTWTDLYEKHLSKFMQRPAPEPPEVTSCDATKQAG